MTFLQFYGSQILQLFTVFEGCFKITLISRFLERHDLFFGNFHQPGLIICIGNRMGPSKIKD